MSDGSIQTESRTIILGPYSSIVRSLGGDVREYQFPVMPSPPIRTGRTKIFPTRATLGPSDPDVDDTLTTLNFMEVSSGAGVYTIKPASDLNNYWWGVASAEGTDGMTAAREAIMRQPNSYTGNCVPLGRIGINAYALWGTGIHKWDPDAQTFGASSDTLPASVVNTEGIAVFNGAMYFPLGSTGYSYVSESGGTLGSFTDVTGAATPAYSATPGTSNPRVWAFCVWRDQLWALTTAAEGYALVPSLTGASGAWNWDQVLDTARSTLVKIESTFEPRAMAVFPNAQNQESLWVVGRRGLKVFNDAEMRWDDTALTDVPPHPDFGRAIKQFRTGEALHIAGGGGDVIQYTIGGAVVPASGPGGTRDGMPADKKNAIVSFATDLAHLYALFGGVQETTSAWTYASTFGSAGSGDGEFSDIRQIAIDSSGNIYAADYGNDRVQKFNSSGVHQSNLITSVDKVQGVAVDSSGNVYITYQDGSDIGRVRKYDSGGSLQWTILGGDGVVGNAIGHITTDGTNVYWCATADNKVAKALCSTGGSSSYIATSGTGDGKFTTPYGIAYNSITGALFVVDQGNDRVQEISTTGTFVRKFGTSGTGNGQFSQPWAIACNAVSGNVYVTDLGRDDVQEFTSGGAYVRKFGSSGTSNGQFSSSQGIALNAAASGLWASDADNEDIQKFTLATTVRAEVGAGVIANTGKGWHPAWEGDETTGAPTKIVVADSTKSDGSVDYRCFWGAGEECWSFQCRLSTHSSRQAIQVGTGERFAAESYLEWGPFHGGSIAIPKLASHAALLMESADSSNYVTYEYATDQQSDGEWVAHNTAVVTPQARTVLPFGLSSDGLFSEGLSFKWIRQRLRWTTGTATSPAIVTALSLAYLPVPQDAATKAYTVPLPQDRDPLTGDTAEQIVNKLEALLSPALGSEKYLYLKDGNREFRCYISSISYGHAPTPDGPGALTLSVIQIPTNVSGLVGE